MKTPKTGKTSKLNPKAGSHSYIWLRWLSRILLIMAIPGPLLLTIWIKELSLQTAIINSLILFGIAGLAWFFPLIGGGIGLVSTIIVYPFAFDKFLFRAYYYMPFGQFWHTQPAQVQDNLFVLLPLALGSTFSIKYALLRRKAVAISNNPSNSYRAHPWFRLSVFLLLIVPGIYWSTWGYSMLYHEFVFLLLALAAWVLPIAGGVAAWVLSIYLFGSSYDAPAPIVECFFLSIGGLVSIFLGIILVVERRSKTKEKPNIL